MKRFYFVRQTDVSGTSGTGAVCEAVLLSDGRVILRWLTFLSSIAIYDSLADAIAIHGHNGMTDIEWVDDEASVPPVTTERPPGWSSDDPLPPPRARLGRHGRGDVPLPHASAATLKF